MGNPSTRRRSTRLPRTMAATSPGMPTRRPAIKYLYRMQLSTVLVIGLGSFLGGIARYIVSYLLQAREPLYFPWGTLFVNLAGSFCIGLAYSYAQSVSWSLEWRLFIIAGILGGFTTFSALSIETLGLFQRGQVFV